MSAHACHCSRDAAAAQPPHAPFIVSLSDQLHYLYSSGDRNAATERYWYDTRPNLRRKKEDRESRFTPAEVAAEVQRRIEALALKGTLFGGVHVFRETANVPDDDQLRLVVLPLDAVHRGRERDGAAPKAAAPYLAQRGAQARQRPHRLLFLAPDADSVGPLRKQIRGYLAWASIVRDAEALNLDPYNAKQAGKSQDQAERRVHEALLTTYTWLLAPQQEVSGKGEIEPVRWEEARVEKGTKPADAVADAALSSERVVQRWAPVLLRRVLDAYFFRGGPDTPTTTVWSAIAAYHYLPRLKGRDTLAATVADATVDGDLLALAAARTAEGDYQSLRLGTSAAPYFTEGEVFVTPEAARDALASRETPTPPGMTGPAVTVGDGGPAPFDTTTPKPPPPVVQPAAIATQFFGTVELDPIKAKGEFGHIVDEMVQLFSQRYGAKVTVSVEIRAHHPDGFPESLQRAARENGTQLGFDQAHFDA